MKRRALWMAVMGVASLTVVVDLQAKERKPKDAPAPVVQQAPLPPAVYTFTTDEELREFAKLWQQRQGALTRMAVLQGYLTQEEAAVQQVTQELSSKYHLDATKAYTLDLARKALVEVERKESTPALGQTPGQEQATAATTPAPATQ